MTLLYTLRKNYPVLRGNRVLLLIGGLGTALALGLSIVLQTELAIGVEILTFLLLAILAWPDLATLVVLFTIYTNAASVAVKFHGVPTFAVVIVPMVLILPLANYILRGQKLISTPVLLLMFVFLIIHAFGVLISEDISVSLDSLAEFMVEAFILYFLIINAVRTPKMLRYAIWALLIAGALVGLVMLFQQVTHTFGNNYWGFGQPDDATFGTGAGNIFGEIRQPRLGGSVGSAGRQAQVMLLLLPLGLFRYLSERTLALRGLAIVTTGLIVCGLATTFSRSAAIVVLVMLAIMAVMRYIKVYQIAILVVGLALLLLALPEYSTRLTSLEGLVGLVNADDNTGATAADSSIEGHLILPMTAAVTFLDHPILGVGPGMHRYYYQRSLAALGVEPPLRQGDWYAHDLYLGVAADTGVLGLGCFLAIVYITLRNLARVRKRWIHSRPEYAHLATGFLLALVNYLVSGIAFHFAYIRFFWLMMALGAMATYVLDAEVPVEESPGEDKAHVAPQPPRPLKVVS